MYRPISIAQPQVVKRLFDGVEKECVMVEIEGEEYEECERGSNDFWGNSKPGEYGAGLGRTEDDPYKPARTGLLGQMAFGKLTAEPVDTIYRSGGDRQDNLIGKYKYDMKCAMRNYGEILIYHTNEWGKKIPINKDIYVGSYVESENREAKKATIIVVGYIQKNNVEECSVQPGRKGKHKNYVVPFKTLKPITALLDLKKKHYGFKVVNC
jgi:hypothetical protein